MPDALTIDLDDRQRREIERLLRDLPHRISQVQHRATRKATDKTYTAAKRAAAKELGLPQKAITRRLWKDRPTADTPAGHVRAGKIGHTLSSYPFRQVKAGVKVKEGGAWYLYEGAFVQHAKKQAQEQIWEEPWLIARGQPVSLALLPHAPALEQVAGDTLEAETDRQIALLLRS